MARRMRKSELRPQANRRGGLDTQMRDYQATMVNNLTASWTTVNQTAAQVVYKNLNVLRARSREQVENNDYAKFFMTLLKTNVPGPNGFDFQARSRDANGTVDKKANDALDLAFRDWMRPKYADPKKQTSFIEKQRLFIASAATDGEVLCRIRTGQKYGKYGFAIEFIDPGYLDVQYNDTDRTTGNQIEMSIEYDSDDVPVAYHIIKVERGIASALSAGYSQTGVRERIPAKEIIHCFLQDRVGQPRGLPWMGAALLRLNMLGGFEEAALVNARSGAGKMGFLEETADLGDVFDKDTTSGEFIDQSDPGTWHRLPPGVKMSEYDPTYPNNEFGAFTKTILRGIGAGLGVAYHTLANDLEGVNYSSGRLGSQNERDVWTVLQDWMKGCFVRRVYEEWLEVQLTLGTVKVGSGSLRSSDAEKYEMAEFQGRRWKGVDPLKEANANKVDFGMRTTSLSQIIRENAQDPDKVWAEIAEDEKKLEALGIEIVLDKPEPANASDAKKPGDDDEDDDSAAAKKKSGNGE
jgi:lambda family phage portal protein